MGLQPHIGELYTSIKKIPGRIAFRGSFVNGRLHPYAEEILQMGYLTIRKNMPYLQGKL